VKNSDSQNPKDRSKNSYEDIYGDFCTPGGQSTTHMQLIAFVVFYRTTDAVGRLQVLEEICSLKPSPHNIFHDEEGYLCRFELDVNVPAETDEQEKQLEAAARKFAEHDSKLKGEFQYLEIGRWIQPPFGEATTGGCYNG
jgi:hypothetical protein